MSVTEHRSLPMLHTRLDGRSDEMTLAALDLTLVSTDDAIRVAVGRHYDVTVDDAVIVRAAHAIIVRPAAIYG